MSFPHAFSGNLWVQSVDSRLIRAGMTGGLNGYSHGVFMSKVTLVIKLIIGKNAFKNPQGLDESTSPTDC